MSLLPPPLLSLVIALLLHGSGGAVPYLVVEGPEGEPLLELPLGSEPAWIIEWNHSVTGILVGDHYRYEDGRMLLTATRTPKFDAGLGHIPGRGRLESDGDGGYRISGIDEPVPGNSYLMRVGSMRVNHRIVHDGETHSLSKLAAGQRVTIRVRE